MMNFTSEEKQQLDGIIKKLDTALCDIFKEKTNDTGFFKHIFTPSPKKYLVRVKRTNEGKVLYRIEVPCVNKGYIGKENAEYDNYVRIQNMINPHRQKKGEDLHLYDTKQMKIENKKYYSFLELPQAISELAENYNSL